MPKPIDNKIVSMEFDSAQANRNIDTTVKHLQQLEGTITSAGASAGGLSAISNAAATVEAKFSTLQLVVANVLSDIATRALRTGEQFVKSVSVDQVSAGWEKYAEKTTSVQTIMNAVRKETESEEEAMKRVNEQLSRLNWFTDETSYNFTDMTNNIGKFTAQGVELDQAVTAMEGISTWASLSGQGVQQASMAMYNLAQALSAGAVKTKDWMSIENANMATQEFKQTVIDTAIELGELNSNTKINTQNFRENLAEGFFTKDVLLATLDKYGKFADKLAEYTEETGITATEFQQYLVKYQRAGTEAAKVSALEEAVDGSETTVERLREMFDELSAVDEKTGKAIYGLGQKAFRAAQEAKTFTEAINATKDAVSTGFLNVFEKIFGNYLEAKEVWTALANDLYDIFVEPLNSLNKLLGNWRKLEDGMGNRNDLIEGLKNSMQGIKNLLFYIGQVWKEVFPPKTAQDIGNIVMRFKEWSEAFKANEFERFRDIFKGVLKIIRGITAAIKGAFLAVSPLFNLAKKALSYLFTKLQEFSNKFIDDNGFRKALPEIFGKVYDACETFADTVIKVWRKIENVLPKVFQAVGGAINAIWGFLSTYIPKAWNLIKTVFTNIKPYLDTAWSWLKENVPKVWDWVKATGAKLWPYLKSAWDWLKVSIPLAWGWLKGAWTKVKPYLQQAYIFISDKVSDLKQKVSDAGGLGVILKNTFGGLWGTLSKIFTFIKNGIGSVLKGLNAGFGGDGEKKGAVKILLDTLSFITTKIKEIASGGITFATDQLKKVFDSIGGLFKNAKLGKVLAVAYGFKIVAKTIAGVISSISKAIQGFILVKRIGYMFEAIGDTFDAARNYIKMKTMNNFVMLVKKFAIGLALLAGAIFLINKVMGKGEDFKATLLNLSIMALILAGLYAISDKIKRRKGYDKAAKAIILMAVSLASLALALSVFRLVTAKAAIIGLTSLLAMVGIMLLVTKTITKAKTSNLYKVAGVVAVMAAAMTALATSLIAFRLVKVGSAILALVSLGVLFGLMTLISKKTVKLDFKAIAKFSGGVALMSLAMASLGLALLAIYPAIKAFSTLDFWDIVKGLAALGAAMLVFVLVGKVAGGVAVPLIALAGAIFLVGGAIGVAAAGFALLALGLSKLSTIGSQSAENITAAMSAFGKGLIDIFDKVLKWINDNKATIFALIREFRTELIKIAFETLGTIIDGIFYILDKLVDRAPEAVGKLCTFLEKTLDELNLHVEPLGEKFIEFVGHILRVIYFSVSELVPKVMKILLKLIDTLANWITENSAQISKALKNLLSSIIELAKQLIPALYDVIYQLADAIMDVLFGGMEDSATARTPGLFEFISDLWIGVLGRTFGKTSAEIKNAQTSAKNAIADAIDGIRSLFDKDYEKKKAEEYYKNHPETLTIEWKMEHHVYQKKNWYDETIPDWEDIPLKDRKKLLEISDQIMAGMQPNWLKAQMLADEWGKVGYLIPTTMRRELGIESPSKVMQEIAGYTIDGLIVGMERNKGRLERSAISISELTEASLSEAFTAANEILSNEDSLTPVITPVIDLSRVQNGARDINGILAGSNGIAYGAAASIRTTSEARNYLQELVEMLKGKEETPTISNTFNITGDDPNAIAEAVADIIQREIAGREKVWA